VSTSSKAAREDRPPCAERGGAEVHLVEDAVELAFLRELVCNTRMESGRLLPASIAAAAGGVAALLVAARSGAATTTPSNKARGKSPLRVW